MLVKKLVGNFNIASLELRQRYLLLDKLEEKLLFFPDPAAHVGDLLLALLEHLWLQIVQELVAGSHITTLDIVGILGTLVLVIRPVEAKIFGNVLVIVVVNDVVSILANDTHGRQNIQRVIDTTLNILKIDFLAFLKCAKIRIKSLNSLVRGLRITYIAELLVHFEDFVGDLGASYHRARSHLLENRTRQENKLLVLALVVIAIFIVLIEGLLLL